MEKSNFTNTSLKNSLFYSAMIGGDLSNMDLSYSTLRNAIIHNTNFTNTNLENTDLTRTYANSAIFTHSNLRNADLSSADLGFADFAGADLSGANLLGAYSKNANFEGSKISADTKKDSCFQTDYLNRALCKMYVFLEPSSPPYETTFEFRDNYIVEYP